MAHSGTLSQGIKLSYKSGTGSSYTDLTDLMEIPDLGGSAESVEVTTLEDTAHQYINGLIDYGDALDFVFLYAKAQFTTLNGLTGEQDWKVTLPGTGGATCSFKGECSVKLNGLGVNEAAQYTLSIKPSSAMTWA